MVIVQPLLKSTRVIGLGAALLTILLWGVFLIFNPYTDQHITTGTYRVAAAMSLLALLVAWASLKTRPAPIILAFLASFIPVGLYMSGTPGIFRWLAVCNLLYMLAAIGMVIGQRRRNGGEGRRDQRRVRQTR